jgi:site-specific DNA-methyltransferase (adenine-specific)
LEEQEPFTESPVQLRIPCAIEDSGFEIRDMIAWCYYSGFPKSLDISKQIEEEDEAQRWAGWGTALKPAYEPAILARKPIEEGSIARQVLSTGTGAINIDECRFGYGDPCWIGPQEKTGNRSKAGWQSGGYVGGELINNVGFSESPLGRWPANIYQCPKASRREREQGLEDLEAVSGPEAAGRVEGEAGAQSPRAGAGRVTSQIKNTHPTVKPLGLMRWLCRLITPKGGIVLDPFSGSGSTLAAATLEGFDSIGCELTAEYVPIIDGRIKWAREEYLNENLQFQIPW